MKTYRERFIKNHRQEVQLAQNKKGYKKVLIYTGDYYTWEPQKSSLEGIRRMFTIEEAVTILLFVLASIPGSAVSYSPFVVCAALVSLVAWVFEAIGAFSVCFRTLPLQEDDYAYLHLVYRITPPIRCAFCSLPGLRALYI